MKLKLKHTRQGIMLKGESTPAEELLYSEAECIKAGYVETLFPVSYGPKKKGYEFRYLIGTARPLKEVLKAPVPPDRFEAMLVSFLRVAQACDAHDLSLQRVFFDERFFFFDPACYSLRFAYAPVRGGAHPMAGPLNGLAALLQRLRFPDEASRLLALRVLDYVRRSTVFSWPEYQGFLCDLGVLQQRPSAPLTIEPRPRQDRRHLHGYDILTLKKMEAGITHRGACDLRARPAAKE